MKRLVKLFNKPQINISPIVVPGLLGLSLLALLLAPQQMPASYDWLQHTTSESAAQGISGAWLARLGFFIFGLTVLWLAERQNEWSWPVRLLHGLFGLFMVGAAIFSSRPWLPTLPYDPVEDALHSFMATAMGFAFMGGVVLRLFTRGPLRWQHAWDVVAIAATVVIPLCMNALPAWDGLLQRGMFFIAYVWYGLEALEGNGRKPLSAFQAQPVRSE